MRMDPSSDLTAYDVVNTYPQHELERVISRYGEERFARRIARSIIAHRPIDDTEQLAEIVKDAIPAATRRTGPHPARRTFQGIRIEVNGELAALTRALPAAVGSTQPGGRLAVISYHSLEDRAVKRFFLDEARGCVCPPGLPVCTCAAEARDQDPHPQTGEAEANPRSRRTRAPSRRSSASRNGSSPSAETNEEPLPDECPAVVTARAAPQQEENARI